MNTTNQQKLMRVKELLSQNILYYYARKVIGMLFEVCTHIVALFFLFAGVGIPIDPIRFHQRLDESISINGAIHIEELSGLMIFIKVILVLFSITLFCIGMLLRTIRRKNSRIIKASELLDEIMNGNPQT